MSTAWYVFVRKPDEVDEFSVRFLPRGIGLGLCDSEERVRRFGGVPEGMEFRITSTVDGKGAIIWVRPEDLDAYRAQQRAEKDRRSMRRFLSSLPILIGLSIAISLISGISSAVHARVTGSIFGWEVNTMLAFVWGAGVPAAICTLYLIYTVLTKGRVRGVN